RPKQRLNLQVVFDFKSHHTGTYLYERLSGTEGMGQGSSVGVEGLSDDNVFPTTRNLWPDSADSSLRIVDPIQYRGRLWARRGCRVSPLLSDRLRFGQRVGIPNPAGSRPEADPFRPLSATDSEITEIKRVLTVLVQKLNADR